MDSEHRLLLTVHEVAAATRVTSAAIRAKKADPDAIADLPVSDTFTQNVDFPDDFMPRNARKSEAGELPSERQAIRVADAASFDAQSDLPWTRLLQREFYEFESSWCGDLDGFVRFLHFLSPSIQEAARD